MNPPAKAAFSQRYRSYGICGVFGLLDHGFCEGSDMAQAHTCTRRREKVSVDGETELWTREREVVSGV